jgi:hypothetical protein
MTIHDGSHRYHRVAPMVGSMLTLEVEERLVEVTLMGVCM